MWLRMVIDWWNNDCPSLTIFTLVSVSFKFLTLVNHSILVLVNDSWFYHLWFVDVFFFVNFPFRFLEGKHILVWQQVTKGKTVRKTIWQFNEECGAMCMLNFFNFGSKTMVRKANGYLLRFRVFVLLLFSLYHLYLFFDVLIHFIISKIIWSFLSTSSV